MVRGQMSAHRQQNGRDDHEEEIMKPYAEMTKEELLALESELEAQYREIQGKDLQAGYVQRKAQRGAAGFIHGNDGCAEQRRRSDGAEDGRTAATTVFWTVSTKLRSFWAEMMEVIPGSDYHLRQLQLECDVRHRVPFHDPRRDGQHPLVQAG